MGDAGTEHRAAAGSSAQGEQPTLTGLPTPRAPRRRGPVAVAEDLPVARVVLDRGVPHLDREFEYLVPATRSVDARPGVRVRVRFGGQDADGFVVARTASAEHDGALAPLRTVVSPEVVLTPEVLRVARAVAARYAGTLPDVLRLAVPPRHARTEAEEWAVPGDTDLGEAAAPEHSATHPLAGGEPAAVLPGLWAAYEGGPAFLRHVAGGGAPEAVWSALPGRDGEGWADTVAQAVQAARAGRRGAVVVVPSAAEVQEVTDALDRAGVAAWVPGLDAGWVRLVADDGPTARYRAFLATARGVADVVVGTRAAAFAPVRDLGLAVCWDDGDPLHAEPRAPYPHVREVLTTRATVEGCAVLLGGFARSVAAQQRVASGAARPVQASRAVLRAHVPRVEHLTAVDRAADGPAAAARLPGRAWRVLREGLTRGPVLVQVPRAGYLPAVACDTCRAVARCPDCHGPLGVGDAGAAPQCRWCGRLATAWRCPECRGERLRSVRVGSERTAEELGRAFPGVVVRSSGAGAAGGVQARVPDGPALVVATPGAEPRTPSGYAAAVLLDAAVVTSRDGLDVGAQALRTWMRAAALVRPGPEGVVVLVGDPAPAPAQALVRWDPAGFADRELAERAELELPPAVHVVALTGARRDVDALVARASLPGSTRVLGPLPVATGSDGARGAREARGGAATPATVGLGLDLGEDTVRALVRSPWGDAAAVSAALSAAQATLSARRDHGAVRVHAEPLEIL